MGSEFLLLPKLECVANDDFHSPLMINVMHHNMEHFKVALWLMRSSPDRVVRV